MIKRFITSNPVHKKIVPFFDWLMILRIEKMLVVWPIICIGIYLGDMHDGPVNINSVAYNFNTVLFFLGISLIMSSIFISQHIYRLVYTDSKNIFFDYRKILNHKQVLLVSDLLAVFGGIIVSFFSFLAFIQLFLLYLLNKYIVKYDKIFSISKKNTSLLFNILTCVALIKVGFHYTEFNSFTIRAISAFNAFSYTLPFVFSCLSVCIFINIVEFGDRNPKKMYSIASFLCMGSFFIGLILNEPLVSVSTITVFPFYIFAVIRGESRDVIRSIRYPILILNFYVLTIYPLLFFPLLVIYYLSKYYNWHRLGYHYPTFLVDDRLTQGLNQFTGFRIDKN